MMKATLDRKTLLLLYRHMLRIRLVEEKTAELYPEQEMRCPVHLCIGQEAVAAGVCLNLKKEDLVLSNHRAHGHYLAKGGNLESFFAEIYGKEAGCSRGRGGSMHLIDLSVNFLGSTPIVGSTIPVAAGVALAEKLNKRKNVTIAFFGEAAVEEGVFHETLNFAALKKLPILFVCENNFFSVYTPLKERQPARPIHLLAKGHGITSFQVDGNDVIGVYQKVKEALKIITAAKGPVFLECPTYRWREHCGPYFDNNLKYRTEAEFKTWQKKCPIARLKKYLIKNKIACEKDLQSIHAEIIQEIESAVSFAQKSPFPSRQASLNDVYAN